MSLQREKSLKKRVEHNNRSHRIVETAQDNSKKTHRTAAAGQVVMVSEIIMLTFEITGVMYEGLFRSGCLLLHV